MKNCTRCGAALCGCYKTPGDGPICCDRNACELRRLLPVMNALKIEHPWPAGYEVVGMGPAYRRFTFEQLAEVKKIHPPGTTVEQVVAGADQYDQCARELVYFGVAWLKLSPRSDRQRLEHAYECHAALFREFGGITGILTPVCSGLAIVIHEHGWAAWLELVRRAGEPRIATGN
jgi:hypothetical protein